MKHVVMVLIVLVLAAVGYLTVSKTGLFGAQEQQFESLHGSWVIDAEASVAAMKSHPEWDEMKSFAPTVFRRMANVHFEFTAETIVAFERGRERRAAIGSWTRQGTEYEFTVTVNDTPDVIFVTRYGDDVIRIRSESSDDLNYYRWQRGAANSEAVNEEIELAVDLLQKALTSD